MVSSNSVWFSSRKPQPHRRSNRIPPGTNVKCKTWHIWKLVENMAMLRIEFLPIDQILSCSNCEFGAFMGPRCPSCGVGFDHVEVVFVDGSVLRAARKSHNDALLRQWKSLPTRRSSTDERSTNRCSSTPSGASTAGSDECFSLRSRLHRLPRSAVVPVRKKDRQKDQS